MQNISFSNPIPTLPLLFFTYDCLRFIHWNMILLVLILYYRLSTINHNTWHGWQPRSVSSDSSLKCPFVVVENFGLDRCTSLGQGHICWNCIWVELWPWVLHLTGTRSHCCHLFNLQLLLLFETLALTAAPPRVKVTFAHIVY